MAMRYVQTEKGLKHAPNEGDIVLWVEYDTEMNAKERELEEARDCLRYVRNFLFERIEVTESPGTLETLRRQIDTITRTLKDGAYVCIPEE